MLRQLNKQAGGEFKGSLYSSLALAFASLGDAFLYSFLPINAAEAGLPAIWIGVILSVNRFIRIIAHPWLTRLFRTVNFRTLSVIAAVAALVSTFSYGFLSSIVLWVIMRILWGLAFSVLRVSNLTYAVSSRESGLALGISRSIVEIGPFAALFIGPLLLKFFGYQWTFVILSALSALSLLFALRLSGLNEQFRIGPQRMTIKKPSPIDMSTFLLSFITDGLLIVMMGSLLLSTTPGLSAMELTELAALWLALKRFSFILFAPAGGYLADRLGFISVFNMSALIIVAGLTCLLTGVVSTGLLMIFIAYSINSATAPGGVTDGSSDIIGAVSANAIWRDIGAATGTLAGGYMIFTGHFYYAVCSLSLLLILIIIYCFFKTSYKRTIA